MKLLIVGLVLILVLGMGLVGFSTWKMNKNISTHIPLDSQRPKDFGLETESLMLGPENRRISAWYIPVDQPKAGVVLVHGYGRPKSGKAQMLVHADYLVKQGYSVLLIDLYSFGESEGSAITLGSLEWKDVVVGFDFLRGQTNLIGQPVGLMGISMGGAAILTAAGKEGIGDFVITSAAYNSIPKFIGQQVVKEGYWPVLQVPAVISGYLLIPRQHNPIDYALKITVPVLLLHGLNDDTVPIMHATELSHKIDKVKLVKFEAGHDIHAENPEEFETQVINFIEKQIVR